jgi:hypothetical protein
MGTVTTFTLEGEIMLEDESGKIFLVNKDCCRIIDLNAFIATNVLRGPLGRCVKIVVTVPKE